MMCGRTFNHRSVLAPAGREMMGRETVSEALFLRYRTVWAAPAFRTASWKSNT